MDAHSVIWFLFLSHIGSGLLHFLLFLAYRHNVLGSVFWDIMRCLAVTFPVCRVLRASSQKSLQTWGILESGVQFYQRFWLYFLYWYGGQRGMDAKF